MKIEIRNRWTDAVIYAHESEVATMRDAVVAARNACANLRGANLRGADLRGANLHGADLRGANLHGADLSDADLSDADLRGADLSGANLSGANLSDANLSDANLSDANLRGADLSGANLSDADLSGANLSGANLSGANLTPIRDDIWAVLSSAPREVPALIAALKGGRVDGSTYSGECSCLVGTIARARATTINDLDSLKPNSSRPAEKFFMGISEGDTPETSQFSALALQWTTEWLDTMTAAFAPAPAQ